MPPTHAVVAWPHTHRDVIEGTVWRRDSYAGEMFEGIALRDNVTVKSKTGKYAFLVNIYFTSSSKII